MTPGQLWPSVLVALLLAALAWWGARTRARRRRVAAAKARLQRAKESAGMTAVLERTGACSGACTGPCATRVLAFERPVSHRASPHALPQLHHPAR